MILFSYISLIVIALFTLVLNFKNRFLILFYVGSLSILWSLLMRTADLNADFTYYTFMMTEKEYISVFLANINQPVLYSVHWYLHSLINNTYLTWVVSDLMLLFIFYHALQNLRYTFDISINNDHLRRFYPAIFFILLVSWPYFIGFNLTYRQFAGTVILLYGLGKIRHHKVQASVIFIISVFTHNAMFFFAPLMGFLSKNTFLRYLSYIFVLMLPYLLIQSSSYGEYAYVGLILATLYPLTISTICFAILLIVNGKSIKLKSEFTLSFLYIPYLSILSWLLLDNGAAERFGVLSLSILLPIFMIFIVNQVKNKYLVLACVLAISIMPIFLFYNSMII